VNAKRKKATKRSRDAAGTRRAILHAAGLAFTRAGYGGANVREIALRAGVTAALVNRYFGSKERLFAEVITTAFAEDTSFKGDRATLPDDLARGLVTKPGDAQDFDLLLLTLRSASDPRAGAFLRRAIQTHFEDPLAGALGGPLAKERASLILALMAGVDLLRKVIGSKALKHADATGLASLLGSVFRSLVGRPD